jgi:chitin disaccharide deacetylase
LRPAAIPSGPQVILCADDYAISDGVSAGIEELAEAGRLSAISCMVTFPEWAKLAARLGRLRGRIAVGLHLNLTVGPPLGAMPFLAPDEVFPAIGSMIGKSARGAIDFGEVERETARQLDAFAQATGFAPDFLDGHQHVHALPGVRKGVLTALAGRAILVRDPSDTLTRIVCRKMFAKKAMSVSALAFGFGKAARAAGFTASDGFSGFSEFDPASPYARELEAAFTACGPRHLTMCHPGHADTVLAARDGVTVRREQELAVLMAAEGLTARLWRPDRSHENIWGRSNA